MTKLFKTGSLKKYEVELVMMLPVHTEVSKKLIAEAENIENAERKFTNIVATQLSNEKYILANDYWYSTSSVIRWNLHGLKEVNE